MRKFLIPFFWLVIISGGAFAQSRSLQIVVHRGANHLAPENTMASTLKCVEMGTDYVEVDVRMSRDGIFYVLHDETLDRTTNGSGLISNKLSSEIDQLDAGSWFHKDFASEKVPRLKSLLLAIKGKMKIYFDVKQADVEKLIELVHQIGFENDCFFWFGDESQARLFRDIDQDLLLKMNAGSVGQIQEVLRYRPDIIECRIEHLTDDFIELCRKNGLKIMIYVDGKDTRKVYKKVISSEADMINLNKPELMLGLLEKQPSPE